MNCKEIADNVNISTEVLRIVKKQSFIKDMVIILLITLLIIQSSYTIYDRYLDSQFEIETTTTTEVMQDCNGYNSYIHGIGDIYNGAESQNNDKNNKIQGQ